MGRERIALDDAETLVRSALGKAGAGDAAAGALAPAFVRAEAEGLEGVGLAHALTYCDGLETGRIDGRVEPSIERPSPGLIRADAGARVGAYLERIAGDGVHIPGRRRALNADAAARNGVAVASATLESLRRIAGGNG